MSCSVSSFVSRTEYVSRMRVDDLVNLSNSKPITDRWINRYNEPTQVRPGCRC